MKAATLLQCGTNTWRENFLHTKRHPRDSRRCQKMARPKRFELLTYRFVAWCSIQLSYGRVRKLFNPDGSGCQEKKSDSAIPRQEH